MLSTRPRPGDHLVYQPADFLVGGYFSFTACLGCLEFVHDLLDFQCLQLVRRVVEHKTSPVSSNSSSCFVIGIASNLACITPRRVQAMFMSVVQGVINLSQYMILEVLRCL